MVVGHHSEMFMHPFELEAYMKPLLNRVTTPVGSMVAMNGNVLHCAPPFPYPPAPDHTNSRVVLFVSTYKKTQYDIDSQVSSVGVVFNLICLFFFLF